MAIVQHPPADLTLNKYSLEYSFSQLQQATQDFDTQYRLGSGAFGTVYRGIQQDDGTEVAVKVLDMPLEAGFEEEVRVLSKFRHPNLVILMGFARHGPQRFLVYELLAGGDVLKRLQRSNFPWSHRVSAAFDAACGLSHLHHATPKVFHRDIKSANILLDRNGTAKMADFGLSCLSHAKEHRVKRAAGTVGYACPHYARRHVVTEGSEVYSFGIVLLEMLTASPPAWVVQNPEGAQRYQFLVSHINGDLSIAMSLADPEAFWPQQVACSIVDVALQCTQYDEESRPRFSEIVNALRYLRDEPDSQAFRRAKSSVDLCARLQPRASREQSAPQASCTGQAMPWAFESMIIMPGAPAAATEDPASLAAPVVQPLWSLECTFAEGVAALDGFPPEKRRIIHLAEAGALLSTPAKIGRGMQEEFFCGMVPVEKNRSMISREHFIIWATQVFYSDPPGAGDAAVRPLPCNFFLGNLSRSWTMVNGSLLDACGKYTRLHHGDCISVGRKVLSQQGTQYVPFLQFRFDLAGSMLVENEVSESPLDAKDNDEVIVPAVVPCRGTPLAGDVVPLFLLRLEGRGVREGLPLECRLIVHGPAVQGEEPGVPFARLVLGRGHSAWFWERALSEETLRLLAWEHLAFEAWGGEERTGQSTAVAVRRVNLVRTSCVCEGWQTLDADRAQVLGHGDIVVLIPDERRSVWLSFHDLRAPGPGKTCTVGVASPQMGAAHAAGA